MSLITALRHLTFATGVCVPMLFATSSAFAAGPAAEVELDETQSRALVDVASRALTSVWQARVERFESHALALPMSIRVPRGRLSYRAELLPQEPLRARMPVRVDVLVDEQPQRSVVVTFEVHAYAPAIRAIQALETGEALDPSKVSRDLVDLTAIRSAALAIADLSELTRAARPIRAGDIIVRADVVGANQVRRGEHITLQFNTGAMRLETRVTVLADATAGQTVRVRADNADDVVSARLIDRSLAVIE